MVCCPYCGSTYGRKKGIRRDHQRYECYSCGKYFQKPVEYEENELPKILLLDIETSLMKVYVWGLYKQRIPHQNIISDWYVLSWSAKWLYDDVVQSDVVTPEEAVIGEDKRVLNSIWKLLDEADIVIAHNGDRFDLRKLNWRFINKGIKPPTSSTTIDTLKVTRREFASPSYKLDFLTHNFKLQTKIKTSFQLWVDCMAGDKESLDKMVDYNMRDVDALEELYLRVRPYIKNHPNIGVLMDDDICPTCGSKHLQETNSVYLTSANKFPVYRCEKCETPYIRGKRNIGDYKTQMRSVSK
tara:strand:+ start:44 stop:937 length:894 start_codon:yes stop_codon:yes gene_type:complete